jgi:hypothetical protein
VLPFQSPERDESIRPLVVEGGWKLNLEHVDGSTERIELPELLDFLEDPRLKTFAGVAHYSKILEINDPGNYSTIDLGEVVGVSELIINGKSLGIRWYGDHSYSLDGSLNAGKNELHIKVTTVLGNYLKSLEDNPVSKRWVRWQKYRSQGLTGPVRLI